MKTLKANRLVARFYMILEVIPVLIIVLLCISFKEDDSLTVVAINMYNLALVIVSVIFALIVRPLRSKICRRIQKAKNEKNKKSDMNMYWEEVGNDLSLSLSPVVEIIFVAIFAILAIIYFYFTPLGYINTFETMGIAYLTWIAIRTYRHYKQSE